MNASNYNDCMPYEDIRLGVDHLIFDGGGGGLQDFWAARYFFFILPALHDYFLISMSLHDYVGGVEWTEGAFWDPFREAICRYFQAILKQFFGVIIVI